MGKKDHGTRLTAAMLKERAKQLGASVCGIGDIEWMHSIILCQFCLVPPV